MIKKDWRWEYVCVNTILLKILRCPDCGKKLRAVPFSARENRREIRIRDGVLRCGCGSRFPIIDWIPRMAPEHVDPDLTDAFVREYPEELEREFGPGIFKELKEKTPASQVSDSFGYKWKSVNEWGMAGGSRDFMREWMYNKYGWNNAAGYRRAMKNRRWMLDAGAGLGREVAAFCEANPAGHAVGMELSPCADCARDNTRAFPNAHIVQADLTRPPFARGAFDFMLSEGVLHHTPDTFEAFSALVPLLARGGEFAFYVYKKKSPIREFSDDYMREIFSKMPPEECRRAVRGITELGRALDRTGAEITLRRAIPELGIPAGKQSVQRLVYWHFLKCFWNESMEFEDNNIVNFDWYHPEHAHRHTPEEVRGWLSKRRLKIVRFNVEEAGIAVRATKP